MKKLMVCLACGLVVLSLTACNKATDTPDASNTNPDTTVETPDGTTPDVSSNGGNSAESSNATYSDAESSVLEMLTSVWDSYKEEEKFAIMGGNPLAGTDENPTKDVPDVFGLEDSASLDSYLGFPSASVDKIDGAASFMHMMNANTFTCGVYHVADPTEVQDVAGEIKENILKRQWMCGFPDKLLIMQADETLFCAFGNEELVETFKWKVSDEIRSSFILYEEPIA